MPEATEYIDFDTKAGKVIEEAYQEESERRRGAISRAWAYYEGNHKPPLKVQQDGYDDNILLNNIEPFAEDLETLLIGDGVQFDAGGDEEITEADEAIEALWAENRGEILMSNIALAGVLEGHCAVRMVPDDDMAWPKIQPLKQSHFSAFWDPFDTSRVVWYRLQAGSKRVDYVRGQLAGNEVNPDLPGWTEIVYRAKEVERDALGLSKDAMKWEQVGAEFWPYDFPPIVDWQNLPNPRWYYGKADVTSAIKLNDAINFVLSNLNRVGKYYAHPRTVGTGFTSGDLASTAVGGLWTVENPEARIYNLEMTTDAALSRWLAGVLEQALWRSGGLVDPETLKDKIGQLTNFGLRVMFSRATGRIEKKRRLYGEGFEAIINRAFIISGDTPPESLTIIWPDALPEDARAEMETLTAEFDRQLISRETYRDRRGYNNEQEEDRLANERTTGDIGSQILGNLAFNRGQ